MRLVCLWSPLITGGFCGADVPAALAWSSPVVIGDSNRRSGDCRGAVSDTHGLLLCLRHVRHHHSDLEARVTTVIEYFEYFELEN